MRSMLARSMAASRGCCQVLVVLVYHEGMTVPRQARKMFGDGPGQPEAPNPGRDRRGGEGAARTGTPPDGGPGGRAARRGVAHHGVPLLPHPGVAPGRGQRSDEAWTTWTRLAARRARTTSRRRSDCWPCSESRPARCSTTRRRNRTALRAVPRHVLDRSTPGDEPPCCAREGAQGGSRRRSPTQRLELSPASSDD